jgi:actin-related protein 6
VIPWNDIQPLYTPSSYPPPSAPQPAEATLIIDSGFSHTHITPTFRGVAWNSAVRRIDIGGKFLTNYLKELVSLRTWNMMEEPYLISQVKEAVCYVSTDFSADLEKCKQLRNSQNNIVRDYVLPDFNTGKGGHARKHVSKSKEKMVGSEDEQVMVLGNERFCVPELLFNPSDVGLRQAGIAECVMQSLDVIPERLRPVLLSNIVLVGGNANIPGFKERFESDIRQMAPVEATVRAAVPEDPIKYTWLGGARMAMDDEWMEKRKVTRKDYNEHGLLWAQRKMAGEDVRGGGEVRETAAERDRRESRSHKKRRISEAT